jgi:hypothetical protein
MFIDRRIQTSPQEGNILDWPAERFRPPPGGQCSWTGRPRAFPFAH